MKRILNKRILISLLIISLFSILILLLIPKKSSEYNLIEINAFYDDNVAFWAANTNSKNLGEEIDKIIEGGELNFTLEESGNKRIIKSFNNLENNQQNKWRIYSDQCGNNECQDNIDKIKINKDMNIDIIYE